MTRSDGEDASDHAKRSPQHPHIGIRTEELRALDVETSYDQHSRKRLPQGHRDPRITLVVPKLDVEFRLIFLDQIVLEKQSLRLARRYDRLEILKLPQQQPMLGTVAIVVGEVVAHPRAEALGLADVDHLPLGVLPEIHAGTFRQCGDLAGDLLWGLYHPIGCDEVMSNNR